jgi:hypothetical protein
VTWTTISATICIPLFQLEKNVNNGFHSDFVKNLQFMPGSFHLSFFVFCQFWRRSYQNQLSFSGKDSTADFFVFRQNEN